jgi:DNA segregation ATPase FtsK/SpoIIIE, S-DNA-T family
MRSGKTSTLVSIGEALHSVDPERQLFFCATRRNAAANARCWTDAFTTLEESVASIRQIADLLPEIETASPPVVFIDDFHESHEGELGQAVSALLKVGREYPVLVVTSADTAIARRASQYTPLGELRQFKLGLLLAPDNSNSDGDILGAVLPNTTVRVWPEGRGYIVGRGTAELVQVGLPS